jgi:hypothetical protein
MTVGKKQKRQEGRKKIIDFWGERDMVFESFNAKGTKKGAYFATPFKI